MTKHERLAKIQFFAQFPGSTEDDFERFKGTFAYQAILLGGAVDDLVDATGVKDFIFKLLVKLTKIMEKLGL